MNRLHILCSILVVPWQSDTKFEYYYAAVDKTNGETVAISESAVGVLADASEKTGLPRDCFEVRQISRDEYERRRIF
jgi:hypothetical protein